MDDRQARELATRVEGLLGELDRSGTAAQVAQALVELYGEAFRRAVALAGPETFASDDLLAHLLIVHDLHPEPVESRVAGALDEVRPYLESHGGGVELLGVGEGVVRLRLSGSCDGCPSSAVTLKLAVEEAIQRAAPEIERVEADGTDAGPALLQLEVSEAVRQKGGGWQTLTAPELAEGQTRVVDGLLLLRVGRELYAYGPRCPGCGGSLEAAPVRGAELSCPTCGYSYDVRRAGRCLDSPVLHLDPVPLLEGADGELKVALEAVPA